jgi:hypothetical protein
MISLSLSLCVCVCVSVFTCLEHRCARWECYQWQNLVMVSFNLMDCQDWCYLILVFIVLMIEWLTLVPFNSLFSLHSLCNLYVLSYYLLLMFDEMLNCPGPRIINSRFWSKFPLGFMSIKHRWTWCFVLLLIVRVACFGIRIYVIL